MKYTPAPIRVGRVNPRYWLYYVYLIINPENDVIYVGRGQEDRMDHHERLASKGKAGPLYDAIRAIQASGGTVTKVKVFESTEMWDVCDEEKRLIQFYNDECLLNVKKPGWRKGWHYSHGTPPPRA